MLNVGCWLRRRDMRFILFGKGEGETTWRGVGLLAAVFLGSLLFAAVLTPPAYWLVEWWHHQTGSATAKWLLDKGVDVYFDRLRIGSVVLALPWLMSQCHLWSARALGLGLDKISLRRFAFGWLAGAVLILGLALGKGAHAKLDAGTLVSALLAGLILGFLEETIFRGLILRIFYTATRRPWLALALMSLFFAYTHFKVPDSAWSHMAPGVHWHTGFSVAFWTMGGITEDFNAVQFLVLWLLGMTLGALVLRTGSLLPGIGLHAGLVAGLTLYRGSGLTDNWVAAGALAAILLALVLWQRPVSRPTSNLQHPTSNNE